MSSLQWLSRKFVPVLFSLCLLAVAAPVRGDLTSDSRMDQMVAVRNTQYAIRSTQYAIHDTQPPIPNAQSASRTVTYTYDAAGRLTGADYGDDRSIAYTYDKAGNLLSRRVEGPVTEAITPGAGGTLTYTDTQGNDTTVAVPPGAVTQPISLTYTSQTTLTHSTTGNLAFAGHTFTLEAYQGNVLQAGFVFSAPITITIHYSDADVAGTSEDTLTLDLWDGSGWADAATTCTPASAYDRHPAENWLALPVCHLTEFALFAPGGFKVYLPFIAR